MKAGQINKETQPAKVVQFDFQSFAEAYIEDLRRTISEMSIDELEKLYNEVVEAVRSDATIHFIGNGGVRQLPPTAQEIGPRSYEFAPSLTLTM